ncbi:MAG: hypothetical protein WBV16_10085, partial [Desulfobaccales bacterium]
EEAAAAWHFRYIFYSGSTGEQVHLCLRLGYPENTLPSISQIFMPQIGMNGKRGIFSASISLATLARPISCCTKSGRRG